MYESKDSARGGLTRGLKRFASVLLLFIACATAAADKPLNDAIDRSDPNFVKASVLIMGPGDQLFSCAGHACIRLECPTFKLDNCFSYESESVRDKVFTFFAGKLKMGMFAIPTATYLKQYAETGREVRQYRLNLPPVVKQRLWKHMDGLVAQGINLPYDYVARGCAWSVLGCIRAALDSIPLEHVAWSEKYSQTRREIIGASLGDFPWTRFAIHAIVGSDVDFGERSLDKVVLPKDIVEYLQGAKVWGQTVLSTEYDVLLPQKSRSSALSFLTPMVAAVVLLLISVGNFFLRLRMLDWLFLGVQSLAGVFFTYLVVFSRLPATSWNWLIVPFNLFPLIFWKWRQRWTVHFALVLVAWDAFMLLWPHRLTDPAYLVIVLAFVVFYLKELKILNVDQLFKKGEKANERSH